MSLLVAEDEPLTRHLMSAHVGALGYEATLVETGRQAWDTWLAQGQRVVVSDWLMPDMDGLELCRRIRARPGVPYTYFVLLSARRGKDNFLAAMDAGVDDFLAKPVDRDELAARLRVAERILALRHEVRQLESLLQMCSYCKRIRAGTGVWEPVEEHLHRQAHTDVSHGVCPDCFARQAAAFHAMDPGREVG